MAPAREGRGFLGLSHLTPSGEARMVDVSPKKETAREAVAQVIVKMRPATLHAIRAGQMAKGDVLGVARTAGIMAAKRTPDLIPLCHPLRITGADVAFVLDGKKGTLAVAALTVYDMVKAVDRGVVLTDLCLVEKSGGKSGLWRRAR